MAALYGITIEGRSPNEIANDLADLYISQFGQQRGEVVVTKRAPKKRQEVCGKNKALFRAASTAKWLKRCTAPTSAMTRIRSIS